jgi:predicted site-specific integrase-resolvase
MKVLNISRATLYRYTKSGKLKTICEINGQYRYCPKSVFGLLGKPVPPEYEKYL